MRLRKQSFKVSSQNLFLRCALILLICSGQLILAQSDIDIRVIEESAIPYTGFLSKADFDQRFPGQIKASLADLDSGWYVIYEHEGLNYYFGPILLQSIGQDYLVQLTEIVEAAVTQRPSIQDYRLELRFEPSGVSASGDGEQGGNGQQGFGESEDLPEPAAPQSGFWGFVRRLFGF